MWELDQLKKLYFLGIGGIGMSALARYFNQKGVDIYGYDLTETWLTKKLEAEGMNIHYEMNEDKIPKDIDGVIYTPAIPKDHAEFLWLLNNGYSLKKRAEVLGMISRNKKSIAIAGTHGKTSTSSLLSHILKYCGFDITAFLGGIQANENSNFIFGNGDEVVLEADEFDRSFLHLNPDVLAILSMDADHLDIYGDVDNMYAAYAQLVCQIKPKGQLLIANNWFDKIASRIEKYIVENQIKVSFVENDFGAKKIRIENEKYHFDFYDSSGILQDAVSVMPGKHNVSNATVAIKIAAVMGARFQDIADGLTKFKGVKRRFEYVHVGKKILIDDYAHHPEELEACIDTLSSLFEQRKVLGIFQPHLYSRTKDFYIGFAKALSKLDGVIILPIYPAREKPIVGIESALIYNLTTIDNKWLEQEDSFISRIEKLNDFDVIATIGAADLEKHHERILNIIKD